MPIRFYLRPLAVPLNNVWYSCQPMGRGILSKVIATMAFTASLEGKVTNHLLCATAATRLYQCNVDEQLVMETTGHHSTTSVRSYKRTSSDQMKDISSVLYGNGIDKTVSIVPEPVNKRRIVATESKAPCTQNVESVVKTESKDANDGNVSVRVGDKVVCLNFTVNITK